MGTKTNHQNESAVEEQVEIPRRWKVLFHNDNFTPFEFVIELLALVFDHDFASAERVAVEVHHHGKAVAGVYPRAVAKAKLEKAREIIEQAEQPLKCTMEVE